MEYPSFSMHYEADQDLLCFVTGGLHASDLPHLQTAEMSHEGVRGMMIFNGRTGAVLAFMVHEPKRAMEVFGAATASDVPEIFKKAFE